MGTTRRTIKHDDVDEYWAIREVIDENMLPTDEEGERRLGVDARTSVLDELLQVVRRFKKSCKTFLLFDFGS